MFFPLLGAVVAMGAVASEACSGGSGDSGATADDASLQQGTDGTASDCPSAQPEAGLACSEPEGTTCAYGVCAGIYVMCIGGAWSMAPVLPVPSGCPEGTPVSGAACPACFSPDASCLYEQACAVDGSALRATCVASVGSSGSGKSALASVWQLTDETCLVDSGSSDDDDASDAGELDADATPDGDAHDGD